MNGQSISIFMYLSIYLYNGILFSLSKEGNPTTCDNMGNLEGIVLSEKKARHRKTNPACSHLYVGF